MNQSKQKVILRHRKIAFLISCLCCFLNSYSQQERHVVLISIDGFRPDFYLDEKWSAPNLRMILKNGTYAKGVVSVFPSVTYPAHTTLVTGAYPAKHGIYYNAPVDGKKGQWYWEESYIKVPTLWDAVREAGLRSGAVMWPVTVEAPIDYNFPVKRADDDASGNQLEVTLPFVVPATLMDSFQAEQGRLSAADFNTSNTIDITTGNLGAYIIKHFKPDLLALHFVTADHQQHSFGRNAGEVKEAVSLVDSMIGVVIKSLNDAGLAGSTNIIITGDHGFVDATHNFSPNALLQQNQLYNTDAKLRFQSAGGAAFLYAGDRNDESAIRRVKSLLHALPAEQRSAFRIIEREELDRIGVNPEVVLGLAMNKDYVATNNAKRALFGAKKPGGAHGHFPDLAEMKTGFIACGPNINRNIVVDTMGIKDVAPLIARLLHLPFNSPDGVMIPGIIRD